jgi:hypothetical protein
MFAPDKEHSVQYNLNKSRMHASIDADVGASPYFSKMILLFSMELVKVNKI